MTLERVPLRETPVVAVPALGVVFKLESLQVTGSFKARGAWRRLAALTAGQRARGVVAASAGNHGLGVAHAAGHLGIAATVVVPETAAAVKREGIERRGARVIVDGATYDDAEASARRLASDTGAVFVSPFDDDDVIAGNGGDLADELARQVPDLRRVVCTVGGGGLIGGLGRALSPRGVTVIGAQPFANCAMFESLAAGRAFTTYTGGATIAEGCEGAVCERTFALARDHVDHIVRVDEAAIRRAVAFCYRTAGVVAECTAAVAVAALLEGEVRPADDGTTAVVITGGNIDAALLDSILAT
jgi:threonine dehydratase